MFIVRCQQCNKEIKSHPSKSQSCGCANMMVVKGDSVTAVDLNRVVMISSGVTKKKKKDGVLSDSDLMFQEQRRKRKVRKLDFEIK